MDRESLGRLTQDLLSLRDDDSENVLIGVGAMANSPDCFNGSVTVTLRRGNDEATSEAVHLQDAMYLARGKLDAIAKRRKDEAEGKRKIKEKA